MGKQDNKITWGSKDYEEGDEERESLLVLEVQEDEELSYGEATDEPPKHASHSTTNNNNNMLRLLLSIFVLTASTFYLIGYYSAPRNESSSSTVQSQQQPDFSSDPSSTSHSVKPSSTASSPTPAATTPQETERLSNDDDDDKTVKPDSKEKSNEKAAVATTQNEDNSPTTTTTTEETPNPEDIDESLFNLHLPFEGDLHYRRICATVHSSLLCMTQRFPFEVPVQDPAYDYPHPVDERSYGLKHTKRFIDTEELDACRYNNATTTKSLHIDDRVKACLDHVAATAEDASDQSVYSVWTKRRLDEDSDKMDFYGVHLSPRQGHRIDDFFDKHVVLVMGASPAPPVTRCMVDLFGGCKFGGIKPVSELCTGHDPEDVTSHNGVRLLGNTNSYPKLDLNKTFLGVFGFFPGDKRHGADHYMPGFNLTEKMKIDKAARDPGFTSLRKLSIIVEYPIAHCQNQNMIYEKWERVVEIQNNFPKFFTDLRSEEGKLALAEMGYELGHIIAFDGIPQFNPSITGAYDWAQKSSFNEKQFIENKGYPGWIPDYGTQCRGPLPPTSKLKEVNDMSRQSFEDNGLDMKFYGRTWEFANSFWWQVNGWGIKGLDCTHSGESGMSCVHKYFLMSMVDDHYDNLEKYKL